MERNKEVDRLIARVGELPAMPAVVSEVLRITDDPSTEMAQVSNAIQGDPALTAKILQVSNSSYYGMKQYVGTLKLALVILGVREVRNIVMGVSVFETLRDKGVGARTAQEIWDMSLRVAGIAKSMGMEMGLGLQGEEFITGLLHDIGKMVMLRQFQERYQKLIDKHRGQVLALHEAELREFGFTSPDAAMALGLHWNLPQTLTDALWCQYPRADRPLTTAKDPKLAAVVRIAKLGAYDDFETDGTLASLQDEEAWTVLSAAKKPIAAAQRKGTLMQFVKEAEAASGIPLN